MTSVAAPHPAPDFAPAWSARLADLGPDFATPMTGQPLPQAHWVACSAEAAESLGWPQDWWRHSAEALAVLSGQALWAGMKPVASVYSGHQFGVWAGQLGDGRALLLGEVATPQGPVEVQLKGSGYTPYSRMGDGRAVLRSSIREFLCSEAMHGLGIPTTRALCLVGSPLPVRRERAETAAVVTRLAPSFIRFGHFEHFCHHNQPAALRRLADFVIEHHLPDCASAAQPYAELLRTAARRTAEMIAAWQSVGFCHGVMNTDNMSILGLTIDYGPFGFLDAFDPQHICNHSDTTGRYAWERQPEVAWWNLHALAQAFLPLLPDAEAAREALSVYPPTYAEALDRRLSAKLGLDPGSDASSDLVTGWLRLLAQDKVDFTIAHRRLCDFDAAESAPNTALRDLFIDRTAFDGWAVRYAAALRAQPREPAHRRTAMLGANPRVVLRNHLAEAAIQAAEAGDFTEVQRLNRVLATPYDEHPESRPADTDFPPDWALQLSVSCSS